MADEEKGIIDPVSGQQIPDEEFDNDAEWPEPAEDGPSERNHPDATPEDEEN